MKNIVFCLIAVIVAVTSCNKDKIAEVSIAKYEYLLKTDFTNARLNHDALSGSSGTSLSGYYDPSYLKSMFNKNDSLFSEHFYEFCIDMMDNSTMMGENGRMGGHGTMMNGSMMSNIMNMGKMMNYIDSLHFSTHAMMHKDHMKTDSLIYSTMSQCMMLTPGTESISTIFKEMQDLRKHHNASHVK
jgi:hypothetical protein